MKKVFIVLIAFMAVINTQAQKIAESKVPEAVKAAFKKHYPDVKTVKWELEDGKYEAIFKKNGDEMSAVFDKGGNFVESEVEIKVSELPASVSSYVKGHYKGAAIKEASKITKANGEVEYEAEVNHKDLIFDSNGKFIKETKEPAEKEEKED